MLIITLILPLISANLGTYRQGDCVQIKTILNTSSVNISTISYPNSTLALTNVVMNKNGQTFIYNFCDTISSGNYIYDYFDAEGNYYVNDFTINKAGLESSTPGQSIIYITILFFSLIFFVGLLIIGIYLPSKNKTDEMSGYIIAISNLKYFKIFCLAFAYAFSIFISYFLWMLSYSYLQMDFLSSILQFIFYSLAITALPGFIIFVYLLIANWVRDNQISEALQRGFQVNG